MEFFRGYNTQAKECLWPILMLVNKVEDFLSRIINRAYLQKQGLFRNINVKEIGCGGRFGKTVGEGFLVSNYFKKEKILKIPCIYQFSEMLFGKSLSQNFL